MAAQQKPIRMRLHFEDGQTFTYLTPANWTFSQNFETFLAQAEVATWINHHFSFFFKTDHTIICKT
jgi:hypothetical protein